MQQAVGLGVELGAEHLGGAGVGGVGAPGARATFQLMSLTNSSFACTRARLIWTHSWSITRRAVGELRVLRPTGDLLVDLARPCRAGASDTRS